MLSKLIKDALLTVRAAPGRFHPGLLACALLGLVSTLRGENPARDPPPQPPPALFTGQVSPLIQAAHASGPNLSPLSPTVSDETPHSDDSQISSGRAIEPQRAVNTPQAAVALPHAGARSSNLMPYGATNDGGADWVEHYDAAPMEDLWLLPKLFRPEAYGRHVGEGEPLVDASWLNRPYFAGFFLGGLDGDTLIAGQIDQSIGFFSGFRLGWDYDIYWGLETRLGFSELGLEFVNEPTIVGLATDIVIWDASLVYYPWGDSRWRPYVSLGVGLVDFDFLDENALRHSDAVLGVPLGVGLKYRHSDWITMRFDLMDNVALGERADYEMMNNFSLTAGLEFRFGGTRKSYFPWNPSRTLR